METKSTKELLNELKSSKKLDSYLDENKDSLYSLPLNAYLEHLLKEKNISKNEVIKRSCLNQTYGYEIFSGKKNNPSRDKVLMLSVAFPLPLEEVQKLLTIAGVDVLYPRRQRDSVIIFGLENGLSVMTINEKLHDLGESILE